MKEFYQVIDAEGSLHVMKTSAMFAENVETAALLNADNRGS
ncbi:hypothetical protein N7E02_06930 (plasmid) [Aliirhizobium terrae]|nr:hypothetical protein [Rhizobium sp. CC-CFT758]WJH38373.1 hypothetical protein N7E02_06930 [Rhizobium sp. CC-CFT758]